MNRTYSMGGGSAKSEAAKGAIEGKENEKEGQKSGRSRHRVRKKTVCGRGKFKIKK